MESELQRILEGSILTDALCEFIFPNGMLEVEDVSLEESLTALLQADGQMHLKTSSTSEYFSPLQLDSSPFANLEGRASCILIIHTNNSYISALFKQNFWSKRRLWSY